MWKQISVTPNKSDLKENRINQRFIIEPAAQMQIFRDEHHLGEDQGINDGKTVKSIIYLML